MDFSSVITIYSCVLPLVLGFSIDLVLGDPRWLPHPIRLFGTLISRGEKHFNSGNHLKVNGSIFTLLLVALTWTFFHIVAISCSQTPVLQVIVSTVFVFYGLANRTLVSEVMAVGRKLSAEGLEAGRKQLGYIVGRDTSALTENKVRVAALETLSENLSDGVIAPLFYFALGGIPAMMAYKMVNTLDSMIGYKNERYLHFGWCAARLDDLANFIPARLTALIMIMVTLSLNGFRFVCKYGNKHASPNSGYPEAALAGILNCRLGGPNTYGGIVVEKPYIGHNDRGLTRVDMIKACGVNMAASVAMLVLVATFIWLVND